MTTDAATSTADLARADILLLLARLLAQPRDSVPHELNITQADVQALVSAANLNNAHEIASELPAALKAVEETDPDAWALEHTRLFEGAVACPVNETAYVRRDKGAIIADVCGFHEAFGLHRAETGEKPDHIVAELELAAVFLVMAARATEQGELEQAQIAREALVSFLSDHLSEWILTFSAQLEGATALPVYERIAVVLASFWRALASQLGIETSPVHSASLPAPADDDGSPYECDMAGEAHFVPLTGEGLPATTGPCDTAATKASSRE